jgi:hypothetical protein
MIYFLETLLISLAEVNKYKKAKELQHIYIKGRILVTCKVHFVVALV